MESQEKLGKILKKARKEAGLTQAKLAVKAGIHVNYYARIERGEVNPGPEVSGDDLIVMGMKPGPGMGKLLRSLFELQIENEWGREKLLELAAEILTENS